MMIIITILNRPGLKLGSKFREKSLLPPAALGRSGETLGRSEEIHLSMFVVCYCNYVDSLYISY
jgi:hypothetical protein